MFLKKKRERYFGVQDLSWAGRGASGQAFPRRAWEREKIYLGRTQVQATRTAQKSISVSTLSQVETLAQNTSKHR